MRVQTGVTAEAVTQGAKHVLYVEGNDDGLDVAVLQALLTPKIRVKPLLASHNIRSAAAALHRYHPEYWFIIDRDDWDDETVEASWQRFPDPDKHNLLIWRRKELESYFLEPAWLCASRYLRPGTTEQQLQDWLVREANKLLLLESANRVLIALRNRVKRSEGSLFKPVQLGKLSKDEVADLLVASPVVTALKARLSDELTETQIRAAFDTQHATLSGGAAPLAWGQGRWRDLFSAKALFSGLVNQHMIVPDLSRSNTRLTGWAAQHAVATDLLLHHRDAMPTDLHELRSMLERHLSPPA